MKQSVKSYGGLIEEITPDLSVGNPADIIAAMEEQFFVQGPAPLNEKTHKFVHAAIKEPKKYLDLYVDMVLQSHFGKWVPKFAYDKIQAQFDWIDENYIGNPIEGKMSALMQGLEDAKGTLQWQIDMKSTRLSDDHELTNRRKVNGLWQMNAYQFPPLLKKFMQVDYNRNPVTDEDGKRIYKYLAVKEIDSFMNKAKSLGTYWKQMTNTSMHVDAFYKLNLPDHKVDLSKDSGRWQSCFRKNENNAAQTIACRLGLKNFRGGAAKLVEHLMGEEFTASIMSYRQNRCWYVEIGAQRKRQLAKSSYWLVGDELTMEDPNKGLKPTDEEYTPQLTMSQLEKHMSLLAHAKDLGIQDEQGAIIDYMNEEEEFLSIPPSRDVDTEAINLSKFAEDDIELKCLYFLKSKLDLFEITMGDVQSKAAQDLIYGVKSFEVERKRDGTMRGETRWRGGLHGAQESLKRVEYALSKDPYNDEILEIVQSLTDTVQFYNELHKSYITVTREVYNVDKTASRKVILPLFDYSKFDRKWMSPHPQGKKPIKHHVSPKWNPVPPHTGRYAKHVPEKRTVKMIKVNDKFVPKIIVTPAYTENTGWHNANPRLIAILTSIVKSTTKAQ